MTIGIIGIALLCIIISKTKYITVNNPFSVFGIVWGAVGIMLLIGNEYVNPPSTEALACVLCGMIGFLISFITPKLTIGNRELFPDSSYYYDDSRATFLSIIVLAITFFYGISSVKMLMNGVRFSSIRSEYYDYQSNQNAIKYYIRSWFLAPSRYVLIVASIMSYFERRKNKILIANTVLIIVMQTLIDGGRYLLMNAFFMVICGVSLFAPKRKLKMKQKLLLSIITIVVFYVIVYITNSRASYYTRNMTTAQRLHSVIYTYFSGSITYLGEVVKKYPEIIGSTKGINFFAGWLSPFFVVLNFLHILNYPRLLSVIGIYACEILSIGRTTYNAMPSIFGYFYIDGGFVGTFLGGWLFGYICKQIYDRARKNQLLFQAFYILVFIQICISSTRWFFYSTDFCMSFIYMLLIIRKDRIFRKTRWKNK